jgi:hypothetical protein
MTTFTWTPPLSFRLTEQPWDGGELDLHARQPTPVSPYGS